VIELVPLATVATIVQGGRHGLSGNHFVNAQDGFPAFGAGGLNGYLSSYEFDQPGVILSSIGARCGKCFLVNGRWSSLANTQVILPDLKRVDVRFLWYQLNDEMSWLRSGTAQPFIKPTTVKTRHVVLPPLEEQCRIADMLEKADAIRRKRKEAITLTEELLRSTFMEMFGDPVTNPKGWPTESIEELCSRGASLVDGPFGSSLKPEHYVESGVKVVRNWNIYNDRFDFSQFKYVTAAKFHELQRSEVRKGDILITTKGTVGDICVAPDLGGPAVLSASGTVRLRVPPDASYLPEFVVAQMTTTTYKRYLHTFEAGSAQQYLNLSAIKKMRLIRPPKNCQDAFSRVRARIRAAGAHVEAAHSESDRLFDALVEQSFAVRY
jgi:type I restriction enzyme, S subunit